MTQTIILLGSGAIGRGYLPWMLSSDLYDLVFVDSDPRIVSLMREAGKYRAHRVRNGQLESREIRVHGAFTPEEFRLDEHRNVAACFLSVGPRNVEKAVQALRNSTVPLVLCENDPDTVDIAKKILGHHRAYFAVPDVITSNTAPAHLLQEDPLSIVTEHGSLFIEEGPENLRGDITFLPARELLGVQWTAKLYLHNTPHCIAAYLGALTGARYVHEAMEVPQVDAVVQGAMEEMLRSLKMKWEIPHDFLQWYADKELSRFRCKLLFDPVSRVAREPMRKLDIRGRLIGAAQICLSLGIVPTNILAGITGALLFENNSDPDHHLGFLRRTLPKDLFNAYILGLRIGEPLDLLLQEHIEQTIVELEKLPKFNQATPA